MQTHTHRYLSYHLSICSASQLQTLTFTDWAEGSTESLKLSSSTSGTSGKQSLKTAESVLFAFNHRWTCLFYLFQSIYCQKTYISKASVIHSKWLNGTKCPNLLPENSLWYYVLHSVPMFSKITCCSICICICTWQPRTGYVWERLSKKRVINMK